MSRRKTDFIGRRFRLYSADGSELTLSAQFQDTPRVLRTAAVHVAPRRNGASLTAPGPSEHVLSRAKAAEFGSDLTLLLLGGHTHVIGQVRAASKVLS